MTLLPHQERVVKEQLELSINIEKLDNFLQTDIFKLTPENEQQLLLRQHNVMSQYNSILEQRINLWKTKK